MFARKMPDADGIRRRLRRRAVDERIIDIVVERWAGKELVREPEYWMGTALLDCVHVSGVVPDDTRFLDYTVAVVLVQELIDNSKLKRASLDRLDLSKS